jgi:hypothetical protein
MYNRFMVTAQATYTQKKPVMMLMSQQSAVPIHKYTMPFTMPASSNNLVVLLISVQPTEVSILLLYIIDNTTVE